MEDFNERWKQDNYNDFDEYSKFRINQYLKFVNVFITKRLDIADICCGNKYFGNQYRQQHNVDFYDLYPIDDEVKYLNLLEDLNINKKYDLIFFTHALEHFENPVDVLTKLSLMLKEDGILCIVVPNAEKSIGANDVKWGHKQFFNFNSVYEVVSKVMKVDFIAEQNIHKEYEEIWINCKKKG